MTSQAIALPKPPALFQELSARPRSYLAAPRGFGRTRRANAGGEQLAQRVYKPETGGWYSASYMSRLERGWANAPLYVYLRIADALEVDEWLLFARDGVAEEVSAAEMVLLRCLRETGLAPEQALARLVSP
jgi:transcriptional regulator with XRE-family HTH domain